MFIPEHRIYSICRGLLIKLKADINSSTPEQDKIGYGLFDGNISQDSKYDYYEQYKEIFKREETHPNRINVNIGYPMDVKTAINLSVVSSTSGTNFNSIGVDESGEVDDIRIIDGNYIPSYGRNFDASVTILITGPNQTELLCVFYTLESLLISIFDTVQLEGFQNPKISSRDVQLNEADSPTHHFSRAITISYMREVRVLRAFTSEDIRDILIEGTAKLSAS